ncbi:MAG: hypothetical protein QG553_395 [Patescibacteria group bacterium]|nr:hypothetical protein [Patescibacteria group bacterium]
MEIIIPGSESAHGAQWVSQLLSEPGWDDRNLLIPAEDRRDQECRLVGTVISELGLDNLQRWIDPESGDFEFLAPDGFEFVMRGKFMVWEGDSFGPPGLSEELLAEEYPDGYDSEDYEILCVSEFRGPRVALELNYRNVNLSESARHSSWQKINTDRNGDGDRPRLSLKVKAQAEVFVMEDSYTTLPFNLYGRPEPMTVALPDQTIRFATTEAEGEHGAITIELVPISSVPQGIEVPAVVTATNTDELWLPQTANNMTFEEFKQDNPGLAEYMAWKLGGDDQAVIDFHRRVYHTPFADDPVWRAKDLDVFGNSMQTLNQDVARIVGRMSDGPQKRLAQRIFTLAAGDVEVTPEKPTDVIDDEPF